MELTPANRRIGSTYTRMKSREATMASAPTAPSNSTPLRIEGLIKRFGKLTAVDAVSLDLNPGECLGLLGPNGAGKSTLIRSIVGRVIPDAGKVSIFGDPADSIGARAS